MDLNIGAALWLATRATGPVKRFLGGNCSDMPKENELGVSQSGVYTSAAKVVLVGHGADEQCAGYGRHRTKFRQQA